MRTRIKICGITRPEDGRLAADLGVDAIGLVFYAKSPRYVSTDQARRILQALPPFVTAVGLFMDADADEVRRIIRDVPLDMLQFHGRETPEYCRQFGLRYIKSVAMMDCADVEAYTARFVESSGFLLDAVKSGEAGGSGQLFDWRKIPAAGQQPFILAGGLAPDNVAAAIRQTRCYAVDVSSGVEAEKGVKSVEKMRIFVEQVHKSS